MQAEAADKSIESLISGVEAGIHGLAFQDMRRLGLGSLVRSRATC